MSSHDSRGICGNAEKRERKKREKQGLSVRENARQEGQEGRKEGKKEGKHAP